MVKGLYTAHTGMVNEMKRMDVLANNLAIPIPNGLKKREPPRIHLKMNLL